MNKQALIENLVRDAHEKGAFNGTWLYAENGGKVVFEDTDILYLVKKP
ncbi:MAG: hypothetical protein IJM18_09990 [Clostridia bacterium]|nr:hypothetical protein [Clostridia bacterium]